MSLFCSSTPPTSRKLLSKLAPRGLLSFLYPIEYPRDAIARIQETDLGFTTPVSKASFGFEAWFISSLADAGTCQKHRRPLHPTTFFTANRPKLPQKNRSLPVVTFQRHQHTQDGIKVAEGDSVGSGQLPPEELPPEPNQTQDGVEEATEEEDVDTGQVPAEELPPKLKRTREELLELIDQYDGMQNMDPLPIIELPRGETPRERTPTASENPKEDEPPSHDTWPADLETIVRLNELMEYLKEPDKDPQTIYEMYKALPAPRAPYLTPATRHAMLHHLSVVEKKDEISMLRYLSVVDDMKSFGIPLSVYEWNSAVSFVASYVHTITEAEVEAALQMWREMEHTAGVKATSATFNVLFDASCKAGKFVLAEMIYQEMEKRGLAADRYHHVSLIFYYGLRKNADGARSAYRALVDAGEIVDTVVLNALISAFIRASEPSAAFRVYEGMKNMHLGENKRVLPPKDWKKRRIVNNSLKNMGRIARLDLKMRGKFQDKAIVAPDLQTYRILIYYTATKAGDLEKTARLLEEMRRFGLGLHGAIFWAVFKGFASHGGVRYSEWDEERLESVWSSFLDSVDHGIEEVIVTKWLISWALFAFGKCAGKARAMSAWEEIRGRWDPTESDLDYVLGKLRSVIDSPDQVARQKDWILGM